MVQDYGVFVRSFEVNVIIYILDSNDNRLRFFNQTYFFYVFENVFLGQKIGVVKVVDVDIGRNVEFVFLLLED